MAVSEEALASVVGCASVRGLQQLTGGASRQTWAFEAVDADGTARPLILRLDPPDALGGGMAHEAHALRAARAAGVPEPEVIAASDDPAALGAAYIVMELVVGETLAPRILRSDAFAGVRPRLAYQCGEILGRIHSMPVDAVPGIGHPDVLEELTATIHGMADASPALELGLRWLWRHRPPEDDVVICHGDFRNGNLVIGEDGIRAVLDWELVHRGSPMQDLGYLCVRAWRFGGPGEVGGFGSREDLFRGWSSVTGREVDPDVVRWWELYGTVWWGGGCLMMGRRYLSGADRSIEYAAIGRRVHEQEYDVMLLLEEALA